MAWNCSKVRAARAARLFFVIQSMKVLICGVVVAVPVVDAKAPHYLFLERLLLLVSEIGSESIRSVAVIIPNLISHFSA